MKTKREGMPAEVCRVDEQFERWRTGKQGQKRISAGLWEAAVKLCESHSVHRVSRWLRLNHTALQKRAGRHRRPGPSSPRQTFVEWNLPAGIVPGASLAEYVVEVRGRVPRIHVRGASALEVAALVSALGGRRSEA
jgi:hypothetical protein